MTAFRQFNNVPSHLGIASPTSSEQSLMDPAGIILISVPSTVMACMGLWLSMGKEPLITASYSYTYFLSPEHVPYDIDLGPVMLVGSPNLVMKPGTDISSLTTIINLTVVSLAIYSRKSLLAQSSLTWTITLSTGKECSTVTQPLVPPARPRLGFPSSSLPKERHIVYDLSTPVAQALRSFPSTDMSCK
jgi:hypothetical protein